MRWRPSVDDEEEAGGGRTRIQRAKPIVVGEKRGMAVSA